MISKESSTTTSFDLPDEVLSVLPSDPFQQLDVARKITSIALSTRVSALESESSDLRQQLADKDAYIADLQSQFESLDASFSDAAEQLAQAQLEKENLLKENDSLSSTVNKLNRDVAKLEIFKKTLMRSFQEDGDVSEEGTQQIIAKIPSSASSTSNSFAGDDDSTLPPSSYSSRSQSSETEYAEDRDVEASRPRISHGLLMASQTSTPKLTPPGSPPFQSASGSPKTSKPASPRRPSVSFATSRGVFDDRSSLYSSMPSSIPSSTRSSMSGPDTGSQAGKTRADGKEFFRQVRSRLSYEQFAAFLANVKELNSHKQTREETLRKADEIFGPENKDLYTIFGSLITRSAH